MIDSNDSEDQPEKLVGRVVDLNGLIVKKAIAKIERLRQDFLNLCMELEKKTFAKEKDVAPIELAIETNSADLSHLEEYLTSARYGLSAAVEERVAIERSLQEAQYREASIRSAVETGLQEVEESKLERTSLEGQINEKEEAFKKDNLQLLKKTEQARRRLAAAMTRNPGVSSDALTEDVPSPMEKAL